MTLVGLRRAATTSAESVVAAPASLIVTGAFYLMVTSILAGLWSAAAAAAGGEVVGYSALALVWYIATSEASVIAIPVRLIEEAGDDVGSGRVEVELLRPVSLLWIRVAREAGAIAPRIAVCAVLGVAFATVVAGPAPSGRALALAAPALALAASVNLVAQLAFAGASFWIRDAKGAWFLYQKLVFVLGGMLLPLEVLPSWLETAAKLLPFMAMAYAPARLASGHVEPDLIVIQIVWLLVISLGATWVFAAGERRLIESAP